MSPDLLTIDRYPKVNWSREYQHTDGDPADTFGLIEIRIGTNGWRLSDKLLIPYCTTGTIDSLLVFGYPKKLGALRIYSDNDKLFDLEDADRINQAGTLAQDLVTTYRVIQTAEKVIQLTNTLLGTIRQIADQADPETVSEAGIIADFVITQRKKLSPDNLLTTAHKLVGIGVRVIETPPSLLSPRKEWSEIYEPNWLIERYSNPNKPFNSNLNLSQ